MSIYPDNVNRADRVKQLATNIGDFQDRIKDAIEDVKKVDTFALEGLDLIAKNAGFKTLEEYNDAALKTLSKEEQEAYKNMKEKLKSEEAALQIATDVAGGLFSLGVISGGGVIITKAILNNTLIRFGFQSVAIGLVRALSGSADKGVKLIRGGARIISEALETAEIGERAAKALKYLATASKVLTVLSVILEGVILIYEAIEGDKQRTELQKGIIELCSRRLSVKKLQQTVRAISTYASKGENIIEKKQDLDDYVKRGIMTKEQADQELKNKMADTVPKLIKDVNEISDDDIWTKLNTQDKESGAWTNEDPSLTGIQEYLKNNPDNEDSSKA